MVTILYNGRCPICAREIAHYRALAQRHGAALDFADLNSADLDGWALTPDQAKRRLHARPAPGAPVVSGVEAFALLWQALPGWRWLGRAAMLPVVRPLAALIYERALVPILMWNLRRIGRA
jgi:predicted DCC family thiol-disulfide oxidoreductase YuxK